MKSIKFNLLLLLLLIVSCSTKTKYYGKYKNDYNNKITNYLIIYSNNTYLHYYKNDSITLSQKGKWKLSNENYDSIDLFNFCNYNESGVNFKKFDVYFLVKDGSYLNPGFDGNEKASFKRVDK